MTENFTPLVAALLRQCSMCGAAVSDQQVHADWHARLREIVTHGVPMVDPADLDQ